MTRSVTTQYTALDNWHDILSSLESFDDIHVDHGLLRRAQIWHRQHRLAQPLNLHVPSIKRYVSEEITNCSANLWPAISVTGDRCALQCDHCRANVLKTMIPATSAQQLWQVGQQAALNGAKGLLLSGGSNHRNEVNFSPYLDTIYKLKHRFPNLVLCCHTGLLDDDQARCLEQAGIDCAMLDIIGAQDTISQVYHLRRSVDDFEAALCALNKTAMAIIPHIVLGLHYGKLLGEWHAVEMIQRHIPTALVLVIAMPHFATGKRPYSVLASEIVGRFFFHARTALPQIPLLLGCARPAGRAKREIDSYAVCSGLDGIAYPADGIVAFANAIGKTTRIHHSCCSVVPDMIAGQRRIIPAATEYI